VAVPPRWILRAFWSLHRAGYAISGGRLGLRSTGDEQLGNLRLRTIGRRSGTERSSMLFYLADDANVAVVASNAGAGVAPAWWLNLQAEPLAQVGLPGEVRSVRAREAEADVFDRLWDRFVARQAAYEKYASATDRFIPIVILEPNHEGSDA
jgi:deazaflavin-dependent oxidoreductase (nitroreductase family)